MNIAVVGPCGDVGRQIVQQIVAERLLQCNERLTLAANASGASAQSAYGLAADLVDAYNEICPRIDVVLDPDAIDSDLIVMAAGATPQASLDGAPLSRDVLAQTNSRIFRQYAASLARTGRGHEIVLCVSNPNELAVAVFANTLGPHRAIGMGSFLDSLRFRKEIAAALGIRRQAVHAFMVGEHGSGMIPLWSGVHVFGYAPEQLAEKLQDMRGGLSTVDFPKAVSQAFEHVSSCIREGRTTAAYDAIASLSPDVRVVVGPFVTHYSRAKTVIATARATMEFIRTIAQGADALVCGQIALSGTYGIHGTVGVPFVVGNRGVDRVFEIPMDADELTLLRETAASIGAKVAPYIF